MTVFLDKREAKALGLTAGHKYHAETDRQKLTMDGYRFDSLAEVKRYGELKMLKQAGLIWGEIIVHPRYPITISGIRVCDVELDFEYVDDNDDTIYEDVKGFDTSVSRLKRKLLKAAYGITVTVRKY